MELADRSAIEAYRRRLADLEAERADASAMNDPVRAERAEAERDALIDELAAVTGMGGRVVVPVPTSNGCARPSATVFVRRWAASRMSIRSWAGTAGVRADRDLLPVRARRVIHWEL